MKNDMCRQRQKKTQGRRQEQMSKCVDRESVVGVGKVPQISCVSGLCPQRLLVGATTALALDDDITRGSTANNADFDV